MAMIDKRQVSEKTAKPPGKITYGKAQLLTFERYRERRDLISVLLNEDKVYTKDEVDQLVHNFLKRKVG